MNKEEIESLFKKYKVRMPKEKQGQSECYECKRHHKYSLTWTSFLYEYKENYYCFEHIVNILLQQENKQLKDNWIKLKEYLINDINNRNGNRVVEYEDGRKASETISPIYTLMEDKSKTMKEVLDKIQELEQGSD